MNLLSNMTKISKWKEKKSVGKNKRILIGMTAIIMIVMVIILFNGSLFKRIPNVQKPISVRTKKVCNISTLKTVDENKVNDDQPAFSPSDCSFSSYQPIIISELDRASCKRVSQYFIKDKNYVYKQQYDPGSSDYSSYIILKEANSDTFENLKFGYFKDKTHIFYDTGEGYVIVKKVDVNSTQILSTHYIKDRNGIYFSQLYKSSEIVPLTGFDIDTFKPIQNTQNYEQYFKDKKGIYYNRDLGVLSPESSKIQGADIHSFIVLPQYLLAKDRNNVYYEGKIVPDIDAQTFEVLDGGYYKDAYGVYVRGFTPLPNSDPCTFQLIGYKNQYEWLGYAKDVNQVYYRDSIVEGADPATFQAKEPEQGVYGGFDKYFQYQGKYRINK